jgi:MFS family permease
MVQEYSPENRSFANGIYLAFQFTIGAIASLILGYLYDRLGAHPSFVISGVLALIGIVFIFFLPDHKAQTTENMQEV